MSEPSPAPPASRHGRWLAAAFVLALAGFTFFCWHDADRPPVRPAGGGTFVGRDVDGQLVFVNLFEPGRAQEHEGRQGWLYREGHGQAGWFWSTNRMHPWREEIFVREREDAPKPPTSIVASTPDQHRLQVTLPRAKSWGNDVSTLTLQFEHLQFRRRAGLRFGRMGGTREFLAQFPRLSESNAFVSAINRTILVRCEAAAAEFNSEAFSFWRDMVAQRTLETGFNEHTLEANWQLRLLRANLASFCVWSYDAVGGNGNHSHWQGVNFVETNGAVRGLELGELFRPVDWKPVLRRRCAPKAKLAGAPDYELLTDPDSNVDVDVFTLSATGLQIYFNPYILGSGADGEFVVHFDYAELKDLLRTDGSAALLPRAP